MLDILIKNGKVFDGTRNPYTWQDIGIKDGKIVSVKRNLNMEATTVIDATGLAVSPGFIDPHVHSDLLITKPEIHAIKVKKGVTTELLGQDGISVAPVTSATKPLWQAQLKGLNGDIGDWPWESVASYLHYLSETKSLTNAAFLVPHGNIRTMVMGFENRFATEEERIAMRKLAEQGMEEGAVGFSSGLVYPPNSFSDTAELIEICKGVAKYDGCFVVHMRNESHNILIAVEEMLEVARESGVRLHISHFKVMGLRNRALFAEVLAKMEVAREEGIEVTFDQYPYTAGSTVFHAILPPWVHDGGTEKMLARLRDHEEREKIKADFLTNLDYENWVYNCGWKNIVLSSIGADDYKEYEGKSVQDIAAMVGQEEADLAFDLLLKANGDVTMIGHWGVEEDITKAMQSPYHMVGSDSIFGGKPHPRLSGTQPRILGRYVRELNVLTLEEAIHHMTGAPAQLLRLKDRGLIQEGYWADIVIFDPARIADHATYALPLEEPQGIEYVLVNGLVCVEHGECNLALNGQIIKQVNDVSEEALSTTR